MLLCTLPAFCTFCFASVWVYFLGEYWREKGCDLHPLLALPRIMCVVGVAV